MDVTCNKCMTHNDISNMEYGDTATCKKCKTLLFTWKVFKKRKK